MLKIKLIVLSLTVFLCTQFVQAQNRNESLQENSTSLSPELPLVQDFAQFLYRWQEDFRNGNYFLSPFASYVESPHESATQGVLYTFGRSCIFNNRSGVFLFSEARDSLGRRTLVFTICGAQNNRNENGRPIKMQYVEYNQAEEIPNEAVSAEARNAFRYSLRALRLSYQAWSEGRLDDAESWLQYFIDRCQ